eukprot:1161726-Pelagomonas_calceolata.AAC.5
MSKISGVLECALNLGASCILACSLPLIIGGAPSTAPSLFPGFKTAVAEKSEESTSDKHEQDRT